MAQRVRLPSAVGFAFRSAADELLVSRVGVRESRYAVHLVGGFGKEVEAEAGFVGSPTK